MKKRRFRIILRFDFTTSAKDVDKSAYDHVKIAVRAIKVFTKRLRIIEWEKVEL